MILWLDDIRKPWEFGFVGAVWAKTAQEAIEVLKTGKVTLASLDHDLSEEHYPWNCKDLTTCKGTGYDVVCWLETHPEFWPEQKVLVHSANPAGAARMRQVINNHYENNYCW